MKKIFFLLILLFPCFVNASCDYETEKNMTSLSLYVDYSYEFNEGTELFDLYLYNLQNIFSIEYDSNFYVPEDNEVVISNIEPGSNITLSVFGSVSSLCSGKNFRTIYLSIPFINPYYESKECEDYKKMSVCYSRFLNFDLSYTTFKNALKREEVKDEEINDEHILLNGIINFFKKYYIKIILLIVTSIITFIVFKNKFRKSKYGF